MFKVRVGFSKSLVSFDTYQEIFDWVRKTQSAMVRETQSNCVFSILSYEHEKLEAMDRWWFDGDRFTRENILN